MKKFFLLIVLLGIGIGIFLGVKFALFQNRAASLKTPIPTSIPAAIPARINIPKLNVDANIEAVGVDNLGNMDVPKYFHDAAWYDMGPKPGETGSSVIDGHVDTPTGAPAVFADISKLKPNDEIIITDKKGEKYNYLVTEVKSYILAEIPLTRIFSKNSLPMLNLITCAGVYDRTKHMYNQRTVVYSKLANP
jgi:sortase A